MSQSKIHTNTAKFGTGANHTEIEPDGTIVSRGAGITFVDEYTAGEWLFPVGGAPPDIQNVTLGGITTRMYGFDGGSTTEWMANSFEINHHVAIDTINDVDVTDDYKVEWHVHFTPSTNAAGTVVWQLEYVYWPVNGVPIPQTALVTTKAIEANSLQKHLITGAVFPKPSSGWSIGDIIAFNLKRDPTHTDDTYPDDALLIKTALHIPVDMNGSRSRYIK